MFLLIELFVKLLILPFKILGELVELLAHSSHHSHRRRRYAGARPYRSSTRSSLIGSGRSAGQMHADRIAMLVAVGAVAVAIIVVIAVASAQS